MYTMKFLTVTFVCIALYSCSGKSKKNDKPRLPLQDTVIAQAESRINPFSPIDVSPMDMSYYPVDYPKLKMTNTTVEPLIARIIYSRPHLQGRELFHGLLNYNQPWRLGANEATELDLFRDVTIQGKKVMEGRYILYCIPQADKWTMVFNKNIDTWGLKPDPAKDTYRFDIPITQTDNRIEFFTMVFQKANGGANLLMAWDNVEARLLFNF